MKGSKETFCVKFVKSCGSSEYFLRALEVSSLDHLSLSQVDYLVKRCRWVTGMSLLYLHLDIELFP